MRTVVLGATGNVGSALVRALSVDPQINEIVGFARRSPTLNMPKVRWVSGDVRTHDLNALIAGASAVVNLIWKFQPSRCREETRSVDIDGTARVLEAIAATRTPTLVQASSVGAYAPGPEGTGRHVDETWPTTGIDSSYYSRDKALLEHQLDAFEAAHPKTRVVRMRPAFTFQRAAAQEIRRYFLGPFWPHRLIRPGRMLIAPIWPNLQFQVVHAADVAQAYRMAILRPDIVGAFNVAAEPTITPRRLAHVLGGVPFPVPASVIRGFTSATWHAYLQPTPPGWVDLVERAPLLDSSKLRKLGWTPRHNGVDTMTELLAGLRDGSDGPTPPLSRFTCGPLRLGEFRSGIGAGT